jgi:hypothetical protein
MTKFSFEQAFGRSGFATAPTNQSFKKQITPNKSHSQQVKESQQNKQIVN